MTQAHIATNRFGLGSRAGETARVSDPRGWLLSQLDGPPPDPLGDPPELAEIERGVTALRRAGMARDQAALQEAGRQVRGLRVREATGLLRTRIRSDRPFVERWIAFWSNHLCVSTAANRQVAATAGWYERSVIRARAFDRYEEMLLASARHPAMLVYLNNAQSIGPDSVLGRRSGRGGRPARGLNENYARELLELHTVGVDGGYDQEDVIEVARALTGWSIGAGPGSRSDASGPLSFTFRAALHQPGRRRVMGRSYSEGGEDQGAAIVRDLARHPATARFVSEKLVRHFVADEPPPSAVDALARRWLDTEGDLREVARALVALDAAWSADARKFRTPQDWLVAMMRAVDAREAPPGFDAVLRQLRHPLWAPPAPKGFGDLTREWADPDGLMNRAELARSIADRALGGRRRPPDLRGLATTVPHTPGDPLPAILADSSIPGAERMALAFAGPAFQWR